MFAVAALLAGCATSPSNTPAPAPTATAVAVTRVVVVNTVAPSAATPNLVAATTSVVPAISSVPPIVVNTPAAVSKSPESQLAKINLNTAPDAQLLGVPNSGTRMLREFREYRPYASILQFRREIGKYVDAQQVAGYEKFVYVPIVPNSSDAATLQQLPGVSPDVAAKLIAARPYPNKGQFIKQLGELVGAEAGATGAYMVDAP